MSRIPQPFWAVILALLGVTLTVIVIFHPTPENIALAALAIGSNLVSGALGAFAGHAAASSTTVNSPGTINATDPK